MRLRALVSISALLMALPFLGCGGGGASSPATQTISFAKPGTQTVGAPLSLVASASSGLTVSFSSTTTGVCTVSGTAATFVASGTCTIDANQAGNSAYAAAAMVAQSFSVNGESQTITFANPGGQTFGSPLTLVATASSGLTVSFTSTTTGVCTVNGTTATFVTTGTCTIDANQAGNSAFAAAAVIEQSFNVINVYVAGVAGVTTQAPNYIFLATCWKNGAVFNVSNGLGNAFANGITVDDSGNFYAVGYTLTGPTNNIQTATIWTKGSDLPLADGTNGTAGGIALSGSDVYIVGTSSSGTAYWMDGVAYSLADGTAEGEANSIAISGSDVYEAGNVIDPTSLKTLAAYWKNGVATNLTNGITQVEVYGIAVSSSGDVYVVGYTDSATTGAMTATYWKNGVATELTDGTTFAALNGITISNSGDVYVAGWTSTATGTGIATYWKNGVATNLTDGTESSYANAIAVSSSGDVYVAGYTNSATTGKTIATYWKNDVATNLTDGTLDAKANAIFLSEQ
jgi:hypothetical protein